MNVVTLTGNLVKDIKLEYTNNNKEVLENVIAVNKDLKNQNGEYETDYIPFVCFEKKATYINSYGHKGDKIELVGKLRVDNWKSDDGEYHSRTYIVADKIKLLTSKQKTKEETSLEIIEENLTDELPF